MKQELSTHYLLRQVKELIASGYNPTQYLNLWLVGDEVSIPKQTLGAEANVFKLKLAA